MLFRITGLFHPYGALNVKRAKLYEIYKLGAVRALLRRTEIEELGEKGIEEFKFQLILAHSLIGDFISNPEHALLPGAIDAARDLQTDISRTFQKLHSDKPLGREYQLYVQSSLSYLQGSLSKFENLFEYDLKRLPTFSVGKTGIFDPDDLIEHAENHLSEIARKNINPKAKSDFQAAGRCLAFGEFTASGFHAVRALEAVARKYHRLVCGLTAESQNTPLGPILADLRKQLEEEEGGKASDSSLGLIIANLARMTQIYRNPITHPEMTLDSPDAAKEVFDLAAVSISLLEKDFARRSAI